MTTCPHFTPPGGTAHPPGWRCRSTRSVAQYAAGWPPTSHAGRVALLAADVARQLNLPPAQVRDACLAGLLHDIGKLLVPRAVREKTGPLNGQEWRQMQRHPVYSAHLTGLLLCASGQVRQAVRHHHERLDGAGYPDRLLGDEVPLLARILAVCDVYDALISPRSYKRAWSQEAVWHELTAKCGQHFDRQVVMALGQVRGQPLGEGQATVA
ncbi:HD-GYP domain-containing protein [Deinococcus petrolearius]|uniref:HD-GYP domain-containing protein n=1 Tax=Deinococcus petrolearius TaxID=1751295 RepID=A0ABW1DP77_9DEIO